MICNNRTTDLSFSILFLLDAYTEAVKDSTQYLKLLYIIENTGSRHLELIEKFIAYKTGKWERINMQELF